MVWQTICASSPRSNGHRTTAEVGRGPWDRSEGSQIGVLTLRLVRVPACLDSGREIAQSDEFGILGTSKLTR